MGVSCCPARFCLVEGRAERYSFVLRRGGVRILIIRHLASRPSSRLPSRLSSRSPMSCEPDAWTCLLVSLPHHGFAVLVSRDGELMGGGSRPAVPGQGRCLLVFCLDAVGGWGNAVLVIGVPACSLSSYVCGAGSYTHLTLPTKREV